MKTIASFNCTLEYPPEQYFGNIGTHVVDSPCGRYREAADGDFSRFGYRFRVEQVGQPHLAVIRYPDDKRRFMCVMDGTTYDLSTGVFTGGAQPLSGSMLEIRQVFWPRWEDCSIVFSNWGGAEPAAVADMEIFELDDLAPLRVGDLNNDSPHRMLGIQYEDPAGSHGAAEGAIGMDQWCSHLLAYASHTGQNQLTFPICWYHGPNYPSECEPSDQFGIVVGRDRKQYIPWTRQPTDWVASVLEKCDAHGVDFIASLTLLRLGSLLKGMNVDLESIKGGADTYNNMLWCDEVQAGTMDWTVTYNVENFPALVEPGPRGKAGHYPDDFSWAYGEKWKQPYPAGPMFNPLHPVVQQAILRLVREIGARYAKYPAFRGIALNLWQSSILWFGSLRSGYDDYSVGLFERETGISVPVEAQAPDRFSRRHQFLTSVCRPAWIAWRCEKIRELICRISETLRAERDDLTLTLTFWNEMTIPGILGGPIGAGHQLFARPGNLEIYREAGIDVHLYTDQLGIKLDLQLETLRDRGGWGAKKGVGVETSMYRDHDFLDEPLLNTFSRAPQGGAFIFNSWVEAWGKHVWFPCASDDSQANEFVLGANRSVVGIFLINSEYDPDGFWWDSQLRITHAFPPAPHFMELYAHAVAELDAVQISRGGLFLDKAHTAELREFSRSYTSLPAEKFEDFGDSNDPVVARKLRHRGRLYFYAVNREHYQAKVTFLFAKPPGSAVVDLSDGTSVSPQSEGLQLTLGSYGLRSFAAPENTELVGVKVECDEIMVAATLNAGRQALDRVETQLRNGVRIPGLLMLRKTLMVALDRRMPAKIRRLLTSFPLRTSNQLSDSNTLTLKTSSNP